MPRLIAPALRLLALMAFSATASAALPSKSAQDLSTPGIYKLAVDPKVSLADAADSMRLRANALNLKLVAELPLSKQVEAMTGKPQRTITIFQFCDALTAKQLIEVNIDFAIFLPCRIALIEDEKGRGWLVMMDVDTKAIAREKRLPRELGKRIEEVRAMLVEIMKAGANGEL